MSHPHTRSIGSKVGRVTVALVSATALASAAAAAPAVATTTTSTSTAGAQSSSVGYQLPTPYLGWSSWSMQAVRSSTANPNGDYSYLTEATIESNAKLMARELKSAGYTYVNIDAGWWRTWNWTPVYDQYGRPAVWSTRIPDGMKSVVKYIHSLGLKVGIYMPAGMETGLEGDLKASGGQDLTKKVLGHPECTLADAIYPDKRLTNGWNSAYQLDYENGNGCAAAYTDSIVQLFKSWGGVDLLKLDGFGPGSGHDDVTATPQYDNRAELREYAAAFNRTGQRTAIQISWAIPQAYLDSLWPYADSWRTQSDVECYCSTLTDWRSASTRFDAVAAWAGLDSKQRGWNNLDSLEVGSAAWDGLTLTERHTVMNLWSIARAPLYIGDDLANLDADGLAMLTNKRILAVDQDTTAALRVLSKTNGQYVFARTLKNGDVALGVFNTGDSSTSISVSLADLGLSASATGYRLTDLTTGTRTTSDASYSVTLDAHASVLLTVSAVHAHR